MSAESKDPKDEANKAFPPFLDKDKDGKDGKDAEKDKDKKDKDKMDKSMITEDDLVKSAEKLEQLAKSGPAARKQELLAKAAHGTCSADETAELVKALQGATDQELTEEVNKALNGNGDAEFSKSINVTPYITKAHENLVKSVTKMTDAISKSEAKRSDDTFVLAKALSDVTKACIAQGRMLKSIQQKLGIIATQPAHQPRAARSPEELEKAARDRGVQPGAGASGQQLSTDDVMNTLEAMFAKSMQQDAEDRRGITVTGERYEEAISKFEQLREIHPQLLQHVMQFRRAQAQGRAS